MNINNGFIDLHVHTNKSDGSLSPIDIVNLAIANRLSAIAITDHNTMEAVEDCMFAAVGTGLEIIAGVEISAEYKPELHILAYFFDNRFLNLLTWLYDVRELRPISVALKTIERLNELGYSITEDEVKSVAKDKQINIHDIARVLVKKKAFNSEREAIGRLFSFDAIAYIPSRPSIEEVIDKVVKLGGAPVLAHPANYGKDLDELEALIVRMNNIGLVGIEVYHSDASEVMQRKLEEIAAKYDLVKTGGSDFHGSLKPGIALGFGRDNLKNEYSMLEKLRGAVEK